MPDSSSHVNYFDVRNSTASEWASNASIETRSSGGTYKLSAWREESQRADPAAVRMATRSRKGYWRTCPAIAKSDGG
jgi:hypothetical protein